MKLQGITLANFRSFAGESEVPFGRITSLIGPNGAGKSNILHGLQAVAAILSGAEYRPEKTDYFDDNDGTEMRLGTTIELSDAERRVLLDRPNIKSAADLHENIAGGMLFRLVKYTAVFAGRDLKKEEILLSTGSGEFKVFAYAGPIGGNYTVASRSMNIADPQRSTLPPLTPQPWRGQPAGVAKLFNLLDDSLLPAVQALFSGLRYVPAGRAIPPAVPVRQSDGLTPDGKNLPNELNDLRRAEQTEFDKSMASVTHGDPSGVEPRTVGTDLVLEVRERGLSRRAVHTDLGSGQLQTLILGWQMHRGRGTLFAVKEPELHLHAERQRSILRTIHDKSRADDAQFVIETHSPVFLGAGPDERVVLVAKDTGRSRVVEIGPDNVGLIRREMGITHADALRPANILFVEGRSDLVSLQPFLEAVAPEHARSTMIYSLDGAYNTKNLGMLIRYLRIEDRRMFAILDSDDEARRLVEKLESEGLLDDNCHFLEKNIEDEFDDGLLVKAARKMASEAGCGFALTAAELRAARDGGEAAAAALKRRWNSKKCGHFSKVRLAENVVSLAGGRVPPGIKAALGAAAAYFEAGGSGAGGGPDRPEQGGGRGGDRT